MPMWTNDVKHRTRNYNECLNYVFASNLMKMYMCVCVCAGDVASVAASDVSNHACMHAHFVLFARVDLFEQQQD